MLFFKLYFPLLSFVCLWHSVNGLSYVIKYPQIKAKLFNPEPGKVAFQFTWDPVPDWDKDNPVIGYRLVFWEMRIPKKEIFIDGELKLVDDDNPFTSRVPVDFPKIYEVPPTERRVVVNDIKHGKWYEYAALAFTKKGEGPLSSPAGVRVGGSPKTEDPVGVKEEGAKDRPIGVTVETPKK